ncbi:metabotropic glutamate receptor-like [Glandiceps talaboti]
MYSSSIDPQQGKVYRKPGDIVLGGLFNMRSYSMVEGKCVPYSSLGYYIRMMSMVYAVDEINRQDDVLPHLQLGFEIYDDCASEDTAIMIALQLLRLEESGTGDGVDDVRTSCCSQSPVHGVIGPLRSSTSIATGKLFSIYQTPQISPSATTDELSDVSRFPYFLRTVPPDKLQVQTIIDLLLHFNWTYISVVNSDESYGRNGAGELKRRLSDYDICIAESVVVSDFTSETNIENAVARLYSNGKAKVIVMFSLLKQIRRLFAAMYKLNYTNYFTFIAADAWGRSVNNFDPYYDVAKGGIFLEYITTPVPEFEGFIRSHVSNFSLSETPWTAEYLRCHSDDNSTNCIQEQLDEHFSQSSGVSPIIDAVHVFALGYHTYLNERCNTSSANDMTYQSCIHTNLANLTRGNVLNILLNTNFSGKTGQIRFTKEGDYLGKYILRNLQVVDGSYKMVKVGEWDSQYQHRLLLNVEDLQWNSGSGQLGRPSSVCSEPCRTGHAVVPLDMCCWGCFRCQDNEITVNGTTCVGCGVHQWPSEDRVSCEPIIATYLKWTDPWSIMSSLFCSIGLLLSILATIGYIYHRNHFLIKSSSRELSAILLVAVVLCYLTCIVLLAKPTKSTCCTVRISYMLCFTLIYSPTLTKAIRIYRIFNRSHKSMKSLKATSSASQLLIATLFLLPQILISTIWIVLVPPAPIPLMASAREKRVDLTCNITQGEMISSLVYNLTLILFCCYFAFKTRKVPDNYNESRFITMSVYTTLIIWLAFIPTYFTAQFSTSKILLLDLALMLNSSVTLLCLFAPKFYAIYFAKNMVQPFTTISRSKQPATVNQEQFMMQR